MENLEQFNLSVLSAEDLITIDGGVPVTIGGRKMDLPEGTIIIIVPPIKK